MTGDHISTQRAIARGGVEIGPIASQNYAVSKAIQGTAIAGLDIYIQKKAPKYKWPYRILIVAAGTLLIVHNNKVMR